MTNVDLTSLRALLGNDDSLVQRFIGIFKNQTPELLAQIRQGLSGQDWDNTSIAAHSLKTQCRYFGLEELAELAEQIEQEPAAPETMGKLLELEKYLTEVMRDLK